ncbi:MAG: hypothetical protein RR772_07615, partial [Gordonibacter sp.]
MLCATGSTARSLDEHVLGSFEDVWTEPTDAQLTAFCFRKLLEREKLAADLSLERRYLDAVID